MEQMGAAEQRNSKLIFSCALLHHNNKVEKELEQFDDLLNRNNVLYKHAKWKVFFSDDFRRSFGKLTCDGLKKLVLNLLLRLSTGWRPENRNSGLSREDSSQSLNQSDVEGLYILSTIDIVKDIEYVQVIKVWDILPFEEIPILTKRLENIYSAYTEDYISRLFEGDWVVPRCWAASQEVIRFGHLVNNEMSVNSGGSRNCVENSKVSESLLLMKFYSFSFEVVCHLLSGREVDLPMLVTDEQMDVILFGKSSFIIGRSGTGKTTVLTMKLFQNEQRFCNESQGIYEAENSHFRDAEVVEDPVNTVLRQLFVTVSPQLCYAVKQRVSQLKSISGNGNSSAEISFDDADVTSKFSDLPDTFIDIPGNIYPLVITFHKFLMMLDGTLGNSFFERFHEAKGGSVALQSFIRLREVTFDRFCSLYWPHFNSNLTKKLDPSRVFTEIISHIKGGSDGKLSFEGYSLLAKSRSSTLSEQKRDNVYTLFQSYEKLKTERREFDMGDFVNDIHQRLLNGNYGGDQINFVYIDEVQDLSMRQISLFKYICQNVEQGFIFAGDTAQTIARGIDFRFQDIRSLFYKDFISTKISRKQEKGRVSEIKQLKQNFRTHAGVLDLAQSVIDIIYCYFLHSIDKLDPETSLISGEAPVLLESCNDENAMVTIFGSSTSGREIAGFGAEQVILVRDDRARAEIIKYVGRQALVLTILECKGLEFQDVLLYNFFGTSPLKDQWRVMYDYMKNHDLLDAKLPQSFPTFDEARHGLLCSELKQLYVAITRTRQRLWICENNEELSRPMFDYWKMRGLVQMRKLDDSVAQAMQVLSSPQEWRERGKKLFYENSFVMAALCFEKAGDTMWEKLAEACGLRASADQIRGTHPESYFGYLRKAAGMFESIGKLESAASCYYDLREYERAGKLFMDKCGKLDAAAECFTLAGCYGEAAEAYAKGDQFSNCLSVCKRGKLFDKGMQYIVNRKELANVKSNELEEVEQEFLKSCATNYHKHKDSNSMLKFVRAFCSMESKRTFLRSLGCLDELLLLEEESGHFAKAAELARSRGDLLKEADLLEKAGQFKESGLLLLWYVFFNSLWGNGNRGWPLKRFPQKKELCDKVKLLAKMDSDVMYDFVCSELKILSDQHSSLPELKKDLSLSQKNMCLRGEILSIRKILDKHLYLNSSKYDWEDDLPVDMYKHCEDKIFQNRVSVRTLVFYWSLWKKHILHIFNSFKDLENEASITQSGHADFCLYYFGVRKLCEKGDMVYLSLNKDADWIRNNTGNKGFRTDKKHIQFDAKELVFAIRSYWESELLSVGIKVLEILDALRKSKSNGSAFHQSTSLLHIFEVSKFLLNIQYHNLGIPYKNKLQNFLDISLTYFDLVFPRDWRNAVSGDLISLRETDLSVNLLNEIILRNVEIKGALTYWETGKAMMIFLGSRTSLKKESIKGLHWNSNWKPVVRNLRSTDSVAAPLTEALELTFLDDWKSPDYISTHSYVYLLDRLLLMLSSLTGILFTTKSSFVEWFSYLPSTATTFPALQQNLMLAELLDMIVERIEDMLYNLKTTEAWIRGSKIIVSEYLPLVALRLVMMLSLICLQIPCQTKVLLELLTVKKKKNIVHLLPKKLVAKLQRRSSGLCLNLNPEVVAEAFESVGDPLLIGYSGDKIPQFHAPSAIFVDLKKSKQEIMSVLLPRKYTHSGQTSSNNVDAGTTPRISSSNTLAEANVNMNRVELRVNWEVLEEISEAIKGNRGMALNTLSTAAMVKEEVDNNIGTLATILEDQKLCSDNDARVVHEAYDIFQFLSSAFDSSLPRVDQSALLKYTEVGLRRLQNDRPKINEFLNQYFTSQVSKVEQTGDGAVLENRSKCVNTQDGNNKKGKGSNQEKKSKKSKGKKK